MSRGVIRKEKRARDSVRAQGEQQRGLRRNHQCGRTVKKAWCHAGQVRTMY